MKAIILSFQRPPGTRPITRNDIQLYPGNTWVYYHDLIEKLGFACAHAYADSISSRGLGPVEHCSNSQVILRETASDGIIHGVLTDTHGPQGYAITFFVYKSPSTRKNDRFRSSPALRKSYELRHDAIQGIGRSLARHLASDPREG